MTYKYYSVMRPIDIGTIPPREKPVRIENYPEGRKTVTAADGRKLMAWGEVEYSEPLTENEVYNFELKRDHEYPSFKKVGYWMGDTNGVEIIRIEGKFYALNGWNGTDYGNCWECKSKYEASDDTEYTLTPVYFYDTEAGKALLESMYSMEEGTPEWEDMTDKLNEIVSYTVSKN